MFEPLKHLRLPKHAEDASLPGVLAGAPYSVHFRTLGDVAYFMTSLNTRPGMVREIEDRILDVIGCGAEL